MATSDQWKQTAQEIYRRTFREVLEHWSQLDDIRGSYLCDELREALFDLKQAVIDDNQEQYMRAVKEVVDLSRVLQRFYPEES